MSELSKAIDLINQTNSQVTNLGCAWTHISRFEEAAECLGKPFPQEVSMAIAEIYSLYEDAINNLDEATRILKNLSKEATK